MCGTPGQSGFPGVHPMVAHHTPAARDRNLKPKDAVSGMVQPACHGLRGQVPRAGVSWGLWHGQGAVLGPWGGLRASREAAAVRGGGGAGPRGRPDAAGADGIGRGGGEANRAKEGGDREVSQESLRIMRRFQVLAFPKEPELAPSWAAGVARDGKKMGETAPTEAVGCMIDSGQKAKTEILVEA
jgi:hypothetical protein